MRGWRFWEGRLLRRSLGAKSLTVFFNLGSSCSMLALGTSCSTRVLSSH